MTIIAPLHENARDYSMTNYPNDADGFALAGLAAQGVDMSKPLQMEFPVSAPDEAAAENIAKALSEAGYESRVMHHEGDDDYDPESDDEDNVGPSWTVYADVRAIPEHKEIKRIKAELREIVQAFGGKSSYWGVMLDDADED